MVNEMGIISNDNISKKFLQIAKFIFMIIRKFVKICMKLLIEEINIYNNLTYNVAP